VVVGARGIGNEEGRAVIVGARAEGGRGGGGVLVVGARAEGGGLGGRVGGEVGVAGRGGGRRSGGCGRRGRGRGYGRRHQWLHHRVEELKLVEGFLPGILWTRIAAGRRVNA